MAILDRINSPEDLKKLDKQSLIELADELREFLIDGISKYGGHFAANLGVVELSIALHYVFNAPIDKIIYDVGHQSYAHKILTGRKDLFNKLRKAGGYSGFPKMAESEYDAFGTGHSSTSISAALGMAIASKLKGEHDRNFVALIGDGALTGGMAFEGLNHAGISQANITIILNDNSISIDPNVGALKDYLKKIAEGEERNLFMTRLSEALFEFEKMGADEWVLENLRFAADGMLSKNGNFFESLNLKYYGPYDGHDIIGLVNELEAIKKIPGPKLVHVLTLKGKGFEPAEKEQTKWHAPGLFDKLSGNIEKQKGALLGPKFQDVFGFTLLDLAKQNNKVVGITPAMPSGSSMNILMEAMPERAFDVGIAEQHAVTFSAGLACEGYIPFCNLYSTFMQRAYDQIIHDVAVQNIPVIFCLDRAGLVGADGPTHHGAFDLAALRIIPNMVVAAPIDEVELRNMMYSAMNDRSQPYVIRYPRGNGNNPEWRKEFQSISKGKGRIMNEGEKLGILSLGTIGSKIPSIINRLKSNQINVGWADMRFLKPLDEDLLHDFCSKYDIILSLEDACEMGGFGSSISEFIHKHNYKNQLIIKGIPDEFMDHASNAELEKICGLDEYTLFELISDLLKNE